MSLSDLIRSDLKKITIKMSTSCVPMTSPCDDGAPCSCHNNDLTCVLHFQQYGLNCHKNACAGMIFIPALRSED